MHDRTELHAHEGFLSPPGMVRFSEVKCRIPRSPTITVIAETGPVLSYFPLCMYLGMKVYSQSGQDGFHSTAVDDFEVEMALARSFMACRCSSV